jgi:hypothetical protein
VLPRSLEAMSWASVIRVCIFVAMLVRW